MTPSPATPLEPSARVTRVALGLLVIAAAVFATYVGSKSYTTALLSPGNGPWLWLYFVGPLVGCAGAGVLIASSAPRPVFVKRAAGHALTVGGVGLCLLAVLGVISIYFALAAIPIGVVGVLAVRQGRRISRSTL